MKTSTDNTIERLLAAFPEFCHQKGIKATHQRTEIYRELLATEEHPNAETLYERVRERIPSISLDTVYRTLRLFVKEGIISRVSAAGESMRFDANIDRHHHFICTECGLVRDFYSTSFDQLLAPEEISSLGAINSVHVEIRGICSACRKKD
ncbi:MAG: transcriptional repressor [Syntrophotaleaceae bacterium]